MELIIQKSPQTLYEEGLDFAKNQDYTNYHIYMTMAANYNHKQAIKELFNDYYVTKTFSKQDWTITKPFYELTKQHSYSLNYLGYIYGEEGDSEKSLECYQKATNMGNPVAACNLGFNAYNKGDYQKAAGLFEMSCKKKCPLAALKLCVLYYSGHGCKQNFNKAKKWVEFAYKKNENDVEAIQYLGTMYAEGNGCDRDTDTAKEFFELGVARDSIYCMLQLAHLSRDDKNKYKVDYKRAKELYELVIQKSSGPNANMDYLCTAYISLAEMYSEGQGVTTDPQKMIEYYELAISKGDTDAMISLGVLYKNGNDQKYKSPYDKGTKLEQNYQKAKELFEMAVTKDGSGAIWLGYMYHEGKGVEVDLVKAMNYFEQSLSTRDECSFTFECRPLIEIYKELGPEKVTKDHVVGFLIKIDKAKELRYMYNLNDDEIKAIVDAYNLSNNVLVVA